jgi:hypothetical protein
MRSRSRPRSRPRSEAKVVTDGAEDDVGGIAGATFEIAEAEVTFWRSTAASGKAATAKVRTSESSIAGQKVSTTAFRSSRSTSFAVRWP